MKAVTVLRIFAGFFLLVALVLLVLHFICQYSIFWFSIPIACAAILNLIASIQYLKIQKNEQRNTYEDHQND